jgi:hypothetical protein
MTAGSVTLAWIDSRQAYVVRWREGEARVAHLESDVPAHRTETGFTPQDAIEGHRLEHLARFVAQVAAQLPAADDLLLIGPGTVREHLANEVAQKDAQHHHQRRVACRAAGPLTVPQLIATLRHEIGDEPPRKPVRRRLRVTRQPSRQQARTEIETATETDLEDFDATH